MIRRLSASLLQDRRGVFAGMLYVVLAASALFLRLQIAGLDPGWVFTDTPTYLRVAEAPLGEAAFWAGERPFTLPLLYKLLGINLDNYRTPEVMVTVGRWQAVIAAMSWTTLAAAVAASLRRRNLALGGFALIQAFGLSLHVSQWDSLLLSESISTSTFVFTLSLWILASTHHDWLMASSLMRSAAFWMLHTVALVLFSFSRDANAYFLLGFGGLALASVALSVVRRSRYARSLLAAGVLILLTFGVQQWTIEKGERWASFYGTFLQRIYGYSDSREYFYDQGMPRGAWSEGVVPRMDRRAFYDKVQSDPAASDFVEWMNSQGRTVYARYLLDHPRILLSGPTRNYRMMLSPRSTEYRGQEARTPPWLGRLTGLLFPRQDYVLFPALGVIAIGVLAALLQGGSRPWWAVPAAMIALVPPMMTFVWHSDSIEIERHAYPIALQLRLGAWLLLLGIADWLLDDDRAEAEDRE